MMLNLLRELNPEIPFFRVRDEAFLPYGKMISGVDVSEIISVCKNISMPASGSNYIPSLPELEQLKISTDIQKEIFGGLSMQTGICNGYNMVLNALEYHKTPEVNIAVTPFVLLLGELKDVKDGHYDTKNLKAFYAEEGDIFEIYGTTLHFCPCQSGDEGFFSVVMLNRGVNMPFEKPAENPLLFKTCKWLLCHKSQTGLIERKVFPGLDGKNYKILYR